MIGNCQITFLKIIMAESVSRIFDTAYHFYYKKTSTESKYLITVLIQLIISTMKRHLLNLNIL